MNVLDLFSGIGGFSLGLERAGFRTVAFCEIDPYCRRVLRKHWPGVPCYDDVTTLTAARLTADGIICACDVADTGHTCGASRRAGAECQPAQAAEGQASQYRACRRNMVICGGFPCQDISTAGKGAGIAGARSGLWSEYARIIGELRPRYVIVENVAALLGRGLERVLGDLAALGFDAEWHCIPASAVGAPHRRDRVWIIAYPQHSDADSERPHRTPQHVNGNAEFCDQQVGIIGSLCEDVAYPNDQSAEHQLAAGGKPRQAKRKMSGRHGADVADAGTPRPSPSECQTLFGAGWWDEGRATSECGEVPHASHYAAISDEIRRGDTAGQWWVEPNVGRVAHGVPARVDRLRSLGNAVVPQIPEIIGRAIIMNHKEDQWTPPPPKPT